MIPSGTRLGTYEILGPLGAGGMGEVYRALDKRLGREVAIKVLPDDVAADTERLRRFEREARAASALNHPNIVTIHDIGNVEGVVFLVMEHVEGRTVRDLLRQGPLPVRKTLHIAAQAATGLAKAHASGIVHRDIKPENLMVSEEGLVKILDFGLAKTPSAPVGEGSQLETVVETMTSPGAVVGTADYMSPEQARGVSVDFRSDQFSLGSVLYEMLTGQRPFGGDSVAQKLAAIIEKDPEPVHHRNESIPLPVRWTTARCLAKEPADRYASTLDLAHDLRNAFDNFSEISTTSSPAHLTPFAARGPGRYALAIGLVVGLVIGILSTAAFFRPRATPASVPPSIRVVTFSEKDSEPAASRDGRTIAFSSEREGVSRIWLKQVTGGTEASLTQEGQDSEPRFSPDGGSVLFTRQTGGDVALYRVPLLGGQPRKVLDDAISGDWSPDGKRIAFIRLTSEEGIIVSNIGLVDVGGGNERIIASVDNIAAASLRFSPDGEWLASSVGQFGLSEAEGKFILLTRTDGSETRRLYPSEEGGDLSAVGWLEGGRELVYAQGESVSTVTQGATVAGGGACRILRQDILSGNSRVLFWVPNTVKTLDIVDRGHIVIDAMTGKQNLREFMLPSAPHEEGAILSAGSSVDRQPVYSPDGEWLAFTSNRSGNLDIWAVSTSTGDLRRLTDDAADDWDPAFSPNGKSMIWTSRRGGNFEIWMANADGSGARQITRDGADAENATMTPDRSWIVYNSGNPRHPGIWKIRPDGSDATRIVPGTVQWPEVSPDGRYASYSYPEGLGTTVVQVVRIADGHVLPFRIELPGTAGSTGRTRWMPSGDAIAFSWSTAERAGIYVQDFSAEEDTSATLRPLVRLPGGGRPESFGLSPDGRRVTIAIASGFSQILSVRGVDLTP